MQHLTFKQIIEDIKSLKIQGAESVATMAVQAFGLKLKETSNPEKLKKYVDELKTARPTEPALRNSLNYCLENYKKPHVVEEILNHFKVSKKRIAEFGAKKIGNGMTVYTHCHSSTVIEIIKKAWSNGKKFKVFNTETRPRFQGRKTAERLAKEGIPVEHFVDSAGRIALKKADLFLFGCDAITSDGRIINKIGTTTLLHFANKYNVPSYSCTNSWKFDPETIYGHEEEIEERDHTEVWEKPPKGIKIHNPAFEFASPDLMTGIITELGVMKPEALITEVKNTYPWITRDRIKS